MSRFAISVETLSDRLDACALSPRARSLLAWYSRRWDGVVLWIDEPWAEVEYAELATDQSVAMAVFAAPVDVDGGLVLDNEHLLGDDTARNRACFVFLEEVRCRDLATTPDTHAVFAGGLVVERLACFAAPDATSVVEKRLHAALVLSGLGDSNVELVARAKKKVGTLVESRRALARALEGPLATIAERLEDEAVWEVARDVAAGEEEL